MALSFRMVAPCFASFSLFPQKPRTTHTSPVTFPYVVPLQSSSSSSQTSLSSSNSQPETTLFLHSFVEAEERGKDPRQEQPQELQLTQKQENLELEDQIPSGFVESHAAAATDGDQENDELQQKQQEHLDLEHQILGSFEYPAATGDTDINGDETDLVDVGEECQEQFGVLDAGVWSSMPIEGIVGEVLQLARNVPENSTLGELLGPYVGKIRGSECNEILRLMGDEGLVISCLYFYEWMGLHEPSLVSRRTSHVMFTILGRAGMGDKLMFLFRHLPGKPFKDLGVYNSAISGLAVCGRYDDAWKIYEEMERTGIQPDHATCALLITVMRKSGSSSKDVWKFAERLKNKGVKWSVEVYAALIKSFCDEGLKKEALIIQSDMEKKGFPSDGIIYSTLMNAYAKDYQIEEAEGLFTEMKKKGIRPTSSCYNILMDAYSRRMQPEIVENLILEMQDAGLKPNVISYTCLISAYRRQKKMSDRAENAFLRMKKAGIKPTTQSFTELICAYSVDRQHEKAYTAYENMKREGVKPSVQTYTALLDAYRRAGDTEALMKVWKLMLSDKIEVTRVTYNTLLDGFAKQGQYIEARYVVSEFARIGLHPTVMTYNMLMNACARGGQHSRMPQLLKEMAALSLKPDYITYTTMIYAYIRTRDFRRAFYYHKQMVKNKQLPEAKSYQKLRASLDVKAAMKNPEDRNAVLAMRSQKPRKSKKDEFWKNKKR